MRQLSRRRNLLRHTLRTSRKNGKHPRCGSANLECLRSCTDCTAFQGTICPIFGDNNERKRCILLSAVYGSPHATTVHTNHETTVLPKCVQSFYAFLADSLCIIFYIQGDKKKYLIMLPLTAINCSLIKNINNIVLDDATAYEGLSGLKVFILRSRAAQDDICY